MADTDPSTPGTGTHRRRTVLRTVAGLAAALLVLLLVDGALALRDLRTAEREANAAVAALEADHLGDSLAAAEEATAAARSADRRLERVHWRAIATLPLIGDDVAALRAVATTGGAAAAFADGVLAAGRPLVDQGAGALVADGRLDLQLLRSITDALDPAELTPLRSARDELTLVADPPRSEALGDAARQVLDVTERLDTAVTETAELLDLLLDLLGGDGPRRYLVAVQNPGELRGTGGLIGFLAVLELSDGEVALAEPTGIDTDTAIDGTVLVPLGAFSRSTRFDIDAPQEFQDRYGSIGGATFLPSTNVDPDLPTVAPLVLAQYEQASGEELDGLIALDPIGLQLLFEAVGPLDVPDAVAQLSDELPDPIPPELIAEVLLIDSYVALGGGSPDRRRYHAEVATASLGTLLSGGWEPLGLGRAALSAADARHLQLYSTHEDEQRRLDGLGVTGALQPRQDGDDLLAVTVVNIGGNKADVHVAHELRHELDLEVVETDGSLELWRDTRTRLRILNAVDADSDPYISTSLEPTAPDEPRQTTGELGLVRSWVTLWSPPGGSLDRARDLDGQELPTWQDRIHGLETVDQLLDTPSGETTGIEVDRRSPTGVSADGDRVTYPLTLWRQAKGIADHLEVTISAPEGWEIHDIEVAADGPAVGLGPFPFTAPVEVTGRSETEVRLEGAMTADVRLSLELRRRS